MSIPSYFPEPSSSSHYVTPQSNRPFRIVRTPSLLSMPDMRTEPQKLRVLIAANCQRDVAKAEALTVRFSNHPKIETKAICDDVTMRTTHTISTVYANTGVGELGASPNEPGATLYLYSKTVAQLCEWADLLVLAPIDADTLAKMLHGMTGNMLLDVLRSWDVSKKIILVPGMTTSMWENPMTKKQLSKIRRKWNWIRVMSPILWQYDERGSKKCLIGWDGFSEVVDVIKNQAELMTIGHDVDVATSGADHAKRNLKTNILLPSEIWSLIFEYVEDWEVAQALGVYTNLPKPVAWIERDKEPASQDELKIYMRDLEWTLLTKPVPTVIEKLSSAPSTKFYLSGLCVRLIIKFCLTDLLTYLETNFKEVFWTSFGGPLLPNKASAVYGRTEILEWWRTSPSFLKKDYTAAAIDGASKAGFVHVLDWWRNSGLDLKYTEASLEQASGNGHILVLEWWKAASMHQGSYYIDNDSNKKTNRTRNRSPEPSDSMALSSPSSTDVFMFDAPTPLETHPLRLKVGKSIMIAATVGQPAAIRWWDTSGIPYSYSESVAKSASMYGHVDVLETWRKLKGDKFAMTFDNQVLVGPTKHGFVRVLEWWRQLTIGREDEDGAGRIRVEYKTCDIEEALEDSVRSPGSEGEDAVRKWWARNGLNLGMGTSEWMKVKAL